MTDVRDIVRRIKEHYDAGRYNMRHINMFISKGVVSVSEASYITSSAT